MADSEPLPPALPRFAVQIVPHPATPGTYAMNIQVSQHGVTATEVLLALAQCAGKLAEQPSRVFPPAEVAPPAPPATAAVVPRARRRLRPGQ